MNTIEPDDDLRQALRTLDPAPESLKNDPDTLDDLWQRILGSRDIPQASRPRRRWLELAAAAVVGAALVGGGLTLTTSLSAPDSSSVSVAGGAPIADSESATDSGVLAQSAPAPGTGEVSTVARDANAVVAADDPRTARDTFVNRITALNGVVTSETMSTAITPEPPVMVNDGVASPEIGTYPPTPVAAGIWLSVEVPTDSYDEAVAAIAPLGDVVRFSQSSVDLGSQASEVKARIAAQRASLATLQDLMDRAQSISDVITLEQAIAQRQSDLDALLSQEQYLRSQVAMARISLGLITPEDAATVYGADTSWWHRAADGLAVAWGWLGRVLLWTSPVWLLGLGWWLWRRRRAA